MGVLSALFGGPAVAALPAPSGRPARTMLPAGLTIQDLLAASAAAGARHGPRDAQSGEPAHIEISVDQLAHVVAILADRLGEAQDDKTLALQAELLEDACAAWKFCEPVVPAANSPLMGVWQAAVGWTIDRLGAAVGTRRCDFEPQGATLAAQIDSEIDAILRHAGLRGCPNKPAVDEPPC